MKTGGIGYRNIIIIVVNLLNCVDSGFTLVCFYKKEIFGPLGGWGVFDTLQQCNPLDLKKGTTIIIIIILLVNFLSSDLYSSLRKDLV